MSESPLKLAGLSTNGKPPARRIARARDAQELVSTLLQAGEGRSFFNFEVKGMIDGFPPVDPQKLVEAAQSYRFNVNWLEGKARRSAALVPYYDLFSGARFYAEVETAAGGAAERNEWSQTITEEFHEALRAYKGFDFHTQAMLCDFVTFGRGFLMFRDQRDWRFYWMPQHRIFVPDGTECFSDDLEVVTVLERARIHRLWNYVSDRPRARRIGWNVDAVVESIDKVTPDQRGVGNQQSNWEEIEQRIKDKDVTIGTTSSTVPLAHVYTREFSGGISHQIIDHGQRGSQEHEQQFLFERTGRYGAFAQCLSTFFLETEDGSWNGARGLGNDLFSSIQAKNTLKNSAMDMTRLRCSLMLQARTPSAQQAADMVQVGVLSVLPPDFEVHPSTILGDVESPMKMDRALDAMLDANTGTYRQRSSKEGGNPPTAEQVRLDYTNSAVLSNSAVNRFYGQLDPHYTEIYRRMSNPNQSGDDEGSRRAREFQRRCMERGVPQLALVNVRSVRAYRNAGNGSIFMRQQAVHETMPLVSMFPEAGREAWLEDSVSVLTNQTMMRRWLPKPMQPGNAEDHAAQAALENGVLKTGAPVMRTKSQNDLIHLQVHFKGADSAAGSVAQSQGQSASEVLSFLHSIGPHIIIHMQALSSDPTRKEALKEFEAHWTKLAQLAEGLQKQLQKQGQERQKQQEMMAHAQSVQNGSDPQIALQRAEVGAKLQLKEREKMHGMSLKQRQADQKLVIADAQSADKIQRAHAEAEMTTKE